MSTKLTTLTVAVLLLLPGAASAQDTPASAEEVQVALKVLDPWRGRWHTTTKTTRPAASTVTSVATYARTLGDRLLQGDSGVKSDGTQDLSLMTYDAIRRVYPLWVFGSSGVVFYLSDGRWDASRRIMRWESPFNLQFSYVYECRFTDDDTHRCHSVTAAWRAMAPASPNRDRTPQDVPLHDLARGDEALRGLLARLCEATR